MSLLATLATIAGVGMALSNFPQTYKIFKRKSAKDIAASTYLILCMGAIVWILYGLEIHSSPVIISNSVGVLGPILILIGWFLYGR